MSRISFKFILLLSVIFLFWFFFVYRTRIETGKLLDKLELPAGKTNVVWGYPAGHNVRIFEYEGFVSGYDTVKLNPLWISYQLKKEYLTGKKFLNKRKFAPDPEIDPDHTAHDRDFRNSGFDRGHLARQSDMKGRSMLCETQSLYFTNISPQKPSFNRKTWNNLETAADRLAGYFGRCWIITGPYFDDKAEFLNGRIEIPDGFYKIILLDTGKGLHPAAFVLDMDDTGMNIENYMVTVDSVESLTGLDFFKDLEDSAENLLESSVLPLPSQWRK